LAHSPGREEPIFGAKNRVHDYLAEKASEGAIEFTTIATGPFFDRGMYYETTVRRKELTKGQDSPTTSSSDSIFPPRAQSFTVEEMNPSTQLH
jgi:hypothetical protein